MPNLLERHCGAQVLYVHRLTDTISIPFYRITEGTQTYVFAFQAHEMSTYMFVLLVN